MRDEPSKLLTLPLPLPAEGEAVRVQKGPWQIVVERVRGGFTLLAHDGQVERRWFVGVPDGGGLVLRSRVPRYPVRVRLGESVTLAPGGRLRGYVGLPLSHEVMWSDPHGALMPVAAMVAPDLETSWLGEAAGYVHHTSGRFMLDLAGPESDSIVMVPMVLRNARSCLVSPTEVTVVLRNADLREVRRRIVAAPRALVFSDTDRVEECVRGFLGEQA